MKVSVLASGSKGNSTYIETDDAKILVDLGTSSLYVERQLKNLGVDPNTIDAIFLTHTHVDHISGLRVFLKKYQTKVYLTPPMYEEISISNIALPRYEFIETEVRINDMVVKAVKTSHDTNDSNAYIFDHLGHTLAYITDTGYINVKNFKFLQNLNAYIIESNHDVNLLMDGRYPFNVKQRILGDRGHLSNKQCSYYLSKLMGNNTKQIILIHLSEDNNTNELAKATLEEMLEEEHHVIDKLLISEQKERTEMIEV